MATALAHVVASSPDRSCTQWCATPDVALSIQERHAHPRFFPGIALSERLEATTDISAAVRDVDLVIVAVPSGGFSEAARLLRSHVTSSQVVLSATKGLDSRTHTRMSEVLRELAGAEHVGAIGGPNHTTDIMNQDLTALLVASPRREATELAARAVETSTIRVFQTEDLVGMELMSAFKNVAVIAIGIATGLELSINTVGFVASRAFAEAQQLAVALGARPERALDLCGVGDLWLSALHPHSQNRRVGVELGAGRKLADLLSHVLNEVPEGLNTLRSFVELAGRAHLDVPIARAAWAIVQGEAPARSFEDALRGKAAE